MLLRESEIPQALERARAAFPRFTNWAYSNEASEDYAGFTLWGEFMPDEDESMPRRFFVTFDVHEGSWRGALSIGQHCYFWSSADAGDAILLASGPQTSLEHAIHTLKARSRELFHALVGSVRDAVDPA